MRFQAASLSKRLEAYATDELRARAALVFHVASDAAPISVFLFASGTRKQSTDDLVRV